MSEKAKRKCKQCSTHLRPLSAHVGPSQPRPYSNQADRDPTTPSLSSCIGNSCVLTWTAISGQLSGRSARYLLASHTPRQRFLTWVRSNSWGPVNPVSDAGVLRNLLQDQKLSNIVWNFVC